MKIKKELQAKERGITLIALVITIIILLILAGITIGLVTGDNGILTQASKAQEKTVQAQEEENIKLAVMASSIEDNGYAEILDEESFKKELKNVFGNQDLNVTSNGDGSFLITIDDRKYYVNDDKTLINNDDIIEIGTEEELQAFRDDVNSGNSYEGKVILLTNDMDLGGEEWEPIGLYPMESSTPADETNKPFKGIFNGNGNEIDGISINSTDKVQGLFGLVDNGKIINVTLGSNSSISGGLVTGGIIGYAYNGTIVNSCCNKGMVTSDNIHVGGIVGIAVDNCKIINNSNLGIVDGQRNTGGITGTIENNTFVRNCSNIAKVTGDNTVGGIVGNTDNNALVERNFNNGNVEAYGGNEANSSNVGGIIGLNTGTISNCYNTGTIKSAFNNVGGLVGLNRGKLKNSYNIGSVDSSSNVIGAIVGNNNEFFETSTNILYKGEISNCYSLDNIANNLVGVNNSIIGIECSYKNSDELKRLANTLGSSFKEDTEKVNNGYPILNWQ